MQSIHPLDEAMQLQARSFSYQLQKHLVRAAIQGPFQESIDRIQDMSSLLVPKRSIEEIVQEAAHDFDAFYSQPVPEPWQQTASILVVAVDGKGIPLVRPNRSSRSIRPAKGPKPCGKKMATPAAVFTRAPWIRTPDQGRATSFPNHHRDKNRSSRSSPRTETSLASLVKSKTDVIEEVFQQIVRRDPDSQKIIKGLRQTATKRKLFGAKREILLSVAGYFDYNQQYMRYNEYLALGLPIASGSVEGACKHLIKDRLERAGMRWTELMAEAVVRLHAIYLSGDFDPSWPFHIGQDQNRIYPTDRWSVVVK